MRRAARTFAALLRAELRAQLPTAVGIGALAAAVIALARWSGAVEAPLGSDAHLGLLCFALALMAQVALAVPYDGRGAAALWRAIQSLPVQSRFATAARVCGGFGSAAAAALVLVTLELALAPSVRSGPETAVEAFLADAFAGWEGPYAGPYAGLWAGLILCPVLALGASAVLRHGIGAVALSFLGFGALPAAAFASRSVDHTIAGSMLVAASLLAPLMATTAVAGAGLRGRYARSCGARILVTGLLTGSVFLVPPVLAVARFAWLDWTRPEPSFASASARLGTCYALHGGALASISLRDPAAWPEESYWILDCVTLEAVRVPQSALGPTSLHREFALQTAQMRRGVWSGMVSDGERWCFGVERDAGGVWRRASRDDHYARTVAAPPTGWSFERDREGSGETATYRAEGEVISRFAIPASARHSRWAAIEGHDLHFVLHRDGSIECLDGPRGERRTLPGKVDAKVETLRPSPRGRWLVATGRGLELTLIECATGKTAHVRGPFLLEPTDRDLPLERWGPQGIRALVGLDGAERPLHAPDGCRLFDLDGERWLAIDGPGGDGIHVLAANGAVLRTLRGKAPAPPGAPLAPRDAPAQVPAPAGSRRQRRAGSAKTRRRGRRPPRSRVVPRQNPAMGRATLGIARAEFRGLGRLALGLGFAASVGVLWARFGNRVHAPLGSREHFVLLAVLWSTLAVPVASTAFAGPVAARLGRALQPLPVTSTAALLGRMIGATAATAAAWIGAALLDGLCAMAVDGARDSDLSGLLDHPHALVGVAAHGSATIALTAVAAAVTRSALGSALFGVCALLPTLLGSMVSGEPPGRVAQGFLGGTLGLSMPWGGALFALVSVALALGAAARSRGIRARSATARAAAVALALSLAVLAVPNAARARDVALGRIWPAPAFDDPCATLGLVRFEHGARFGLFDLRAPGAPGVRFDRFGVGRSTWLIDTQGMTVSRVRPPKTPARLFRTSHYHWYAPGSASGSPLIAIEYDAGGYQDLGAWVSSGVDADGAVTWERIADSEHGGLRTSPWRSMPRGRGLTYARRDGTTARFPLTKSSVRERGVLRERGRFVAEPGGELRYLDPGTGEVRGLGVRVPDELRELAASPRGRWVAAKHGAGQWSLLDVEARTWHAGPLGPFSAVLDRDLPLLIRGEDTYRLEGPTGRQELPVPVQCLLYDVDGARWIELDGTQGTIRILDADGSPVRTLRGGGSGPQSGT